MTCYEPTEQSAIEDELMATILIGFEDFDVNDTEDEVQNQENGCDGHIGYHVWLAAESLMVRRIWWTLRIYAFSLVVHQLHAKIAFMPGATDRRVIWWA
jgi:hypothetical protein